MNYNIFYLANTSNQVEDNLGMYTEISANKIGIETKYTKSELIQNQLIESYKLNDNYFKLALTYGKSTYVQTDNNILSLEEVDENEYVFSPNLGNFYKYFLNTDNSNFVGNLSYNINNQFNILLTARLEQFNRTVGKEATPGNTFEFEKLFVLPSLNLKYTINEKTNLRFAASKTYYKAKEY